MKAQMRRKIEEIETRINYSYKYVIFTIFVIKIIC